MSRDRFCCDGLCAQRHGICPALHTRCLDCRHLIHRDDDDALVCVECGGRNRRIEDPRAEVRGFWLMCALALAATILLSMLIGPRPWFGG
jgi:hypothetical protein